MHKGFTIIEMVTVIAVMSVIAVVAMPRFMGADTFNTRGDTGVVIAALRYAQKTAVAQHTNVFFHLNTATRLLRICYDIACVTSVTDPASNVAFSQTLSNNVSLQANGMNADGVTATVSFDAMGRPRDGNGNLLTDNRSFTVTNQKNIAQSTLILVEAETGYVR